MKFRSDFVTNSSSSSFIINKRNLSKIQIGLIKDHASIGDKYDSDNFDANWEWEVREFGDVLKVSTVMDNFDMMQFLHDIGVDISNIEREEY